MNREELMLFVLKNRELINELQLSQRQADIVNLAINNHDLTASYLAELLDISISNASTQLKRLSEIGYLKRKEFSHDTGGIEFVYASAITKKLYNTLSSAAAPKSGEGIPALDLSKITFKNISLCEN